MDPGVHVENSSDDDSGVEEDSSEQRMSQIDEEVANAKRQFDRNEARAFSAAMARNRAHVNSMLSVQSMQRQARAADLARSAAFADTSSPELMATFRRRSALVASRESPTNKAESESTLTEEERRLESRRIDGDETFSELWPKLAKSGWTSQKGRGLISWHYLRPGAVLTNEQRTEPVSSNKSSYSKVSKSYRDQHAHSFTEAHSLVEFVRCTGLDGITKTGHVNENLPLLYSFKSGVKVSLSDKTSAETDMGSSIGKRSGKLLSKYEPDVVAQHRTSVTETDYGLAAQNELNALPLSEAEATIPSGSAPSASSPPVNSGIPMEAAGGWGTGVLFGFGMAHGSNQNGNADVPTGTRSLRMQSRGIGTMERVQITPQVLSIAPLAAESTWELADAEYQDAMSTHESLAAQAGKQPKPKSRKRGPTTFETELHSLQALPMATSWVPLKRNVRTQDQKALEYTPYFGDHDASQEKLFGDLFDFEAKQRAIDAGPPAEAHFRAQRFQRFRKLLVAAVGRAIHEKRINELPDFAETASTTSTSSAQSTAPSLASQFYDAIHSEGSKGKSKKSTAKSAGPVASATKKSAAGDKDEVLLAECVDALVDSLEDVAEKSLKVTLAPEDYVTIEELRKAVKAAATTAAASADALEENKTGSSEPSNDKGLSAVVSSKQGAVSNVKSGKNSSSASKRSVTVATSGLRESSEVPALPPPPIDGTPAAEPKAQEERYLEALDSYRHLVCRFCLCYDCNLHRDYGGNHAPAPLAEQTTHALDAEPYLESLPLAPAAVDAARTALALQGGNLSADAPSVSSANKPLSLLSTSSSSLSSSSSSSSSSSAPEPLTFAKHPSAAGRERSVLAALPRAWVAFGGELGPIAAALGLPRLEAQRLLDLAGLAVSVPESEEVEGAADGTLEGNLGNLSVDASVVGSSSSDRDGSGALSPRSVTSDQPSSPRGGVTGAGGRGGKVTVKRGSGLNMKRKSGQASNNNRAYHLHQRQGRSSTVVTASSPYLPCTHPGKCAAGGAKYHRNSGNKSTGSQQDQDQGDGATSSSSGDQRDAAEGTSAESPGKASYESTCECMREQHWCTKFCICAPVNLQQQPLGGKTGSAARPMVINPCPNFFGGCNCRMGHCNTKQCACFVAGRECDPDLCRECGACSVNGLHPAPGQNCRNDNLSMGRHTRLLMARSLVPDAGWGLFTLHAVPKGGFVHEYVGEVVSQDEAERRGRVYDKINRSYLFNLNADFCIDAARKGNKMRFANHSSFPNLEPRVMFVNGEHRIAMYARDDIPAQSELFFDYGYDNEIKSEHLHKQAIHAEWMVDGSMANKISSCVGRTMLDGSNNFPANLKPLVKGAKQQQQLLQGDDDDAEEEVEKKKRFVKSSAYSMFLRDTAVRKEVVQLLAERSAGTKTTASGGGRSKTSKSADSSELEDERLKQFASSSQGMAERWATMIAEGSTGPYVAQAEAYNKKRLREWGKQEKAAAAAKKAKEKS